MILILSHYHLFWLCCSYCVYDNCFVSHSQYYSYLVFSCFKLLSSRTVFHVVVLPTVVLVLMPLFSELNAFH